jgi:putative membrane protein
MHFPLGVDWMWMGVPWVVVLVVVVLLLHKRGGGESPENVLKRRYANGEITKDQYERMLQDLRR